MRNTEVCKLKWNASGPDFLPDLGHRKSTRFPVPDCRRRRTWASRCCPRRPRPTEAASWTPARSWYPASRCPCSCRRCSTPRTWRSSRGTRAWCWEWWAPLSGRRWSCCRWCTTWSRLHLDWPRHDRRASPQRPLECARSPARRLSPIPSLSAQTSPRVSAGRTCTFCRQCFALDTWWLCCGAPSLEWISGWNALRIASNAPFAGVDTQPHPEWRSRSRQSTWFPLAACHPCWRTRARFRDPRSSECDCLEWFSDCLAGRGLWVWPCEIWLAAFLWIENAVRITALRRKRENTHVVRGRPDTDKSHRRPAWLGKCLARSRPLRRSPPSSSARSRWDCGARPDRSRPSSTVAGPTWPRCDMEASLSSQRLRSGLAAP